jgi:hypothetical protein
MLKKIKCECGKEVSFRALKRHLTENNNPKKYHSQEFVNKMLDFILLNRKQRIAWLISEGDEATANQYWGISVLTGETHFEDWTFKTPRPKGTCPPSVLNRFKTERKGLNNPANKTKPIYDLEKLKKGAKELWGSMQDEDLRLNAFYSKFNKIFPYFAFSLSDLVTAKQAFKKSIEGERGEFTYRNMVLSILLDLSIEEIILIRRIDRGKKIKKGQDNPKTRAILLSILKNNRKTNIIGYVTKAQKKLWKLIKKCMDPDAVLEKQFDYKETWKSYDVYSPKYDCLFEMHGHVWHDLNKCKPQIRKIVEKNILNDKIKEDLAKTMGKKLFVFWDDEMHLWKKQITSIMGQLKNEN